MKFFFENKGQSILAGQGKSLEFGAHLHTHLELVYMLEGRTKVLVDSQEHILEAGDALLVFPNQIHQYFQISTEKYWLTIFPASLCSEYQPIFKSKVPSSPIVRNASANPSVGQALQQILKLSDRQTAFRQEIIKGHFLVLLGELFQMMTFEDAKAPDTDTVKGLINYCQENYLKDISLDKAAEDLHISRFYLSHVFTEKLHMKFHDYIAMLRMTQACKLLLNENSSITDIAYEVGFNTPRSFNRAFRKHVGMTPREYRKSLTI